MSVVIVDSHAHLDSPAFAEDLDHVLQRARERNVSRILSIGCLRHGAESVRRLLDILASVSGVFAAFGVHPHDAADWSDPVAERLLELAEHPQAVAVGEIGLDFHYDNSPRGMQRTAFIRQIELARKLGMPIVIHTRESESETADVLRTFFEKGAEPSGVLHCFSGDAGLAEAALERGFYFGVGGILTFKNADALRQSVRTLPEDRILIETDCPYLAPVPYRGKRNEPAYASRVVEALAELRGATAQEVARQTARNFFTLFSKAAPPES